MVAGRNGPLRWAAEDTERLEAGEDFSSSPQAEKPFPRPEEWKMKWPAGFVALALVLLGPAATQGRARQAVLRRRISLATISTASAPEASASALAAAGAAGGAMDVAACYAPPARLKLRPAGATLEDVLNAIVAAAPTYRWRASGAAINLFPARGVPRLLSVRISRFDREGTPYDLLNALLRLPAVRNEVAHEGLVEMFHGGLTPSSPPRRISVALHDVTLMEALNAVCAQEGGWVWAYEESHCRGHNFYNMSFVVQR